MNKRKTYISILIALTFCFSFLLVYRKNIEIEKFRYSFLQKDLNYINSITTTRKQTKEKLISTLSFNNNKLFYDSDDDTFYYSLVEGSQTCFNPMVSWKETGIKIVFENRSITEDAIRNNYKFNLVAYNEKEYKKYNLICTTLPIININAKRGIQRNEITGYRPKGKAKITVFDNGNANDNFFYYDGVINVRGNDSVKYPKLGYSISIKNIEAEDNKQISTNILGLREVGNDYVLYSVYNDQDKIRNVFSTNLWSVSCAKNNEFGIINGGYYKYIELFINNHYWGLYAIGYPIDEEQEQIKKDTYDFSGENIYKKSSKTWKIENKYGFEEENEYVLLTNNNEAEAWKLINNYNKILNNSHDNSILYSSSDVNNSIDAFLFFNLVQGVDNIAYEDQEEVFSNIILLSKNNGNEVKFMICPWDLDRTWGKGFHDTNYNNIRVDENVVMKSNVVYKLLENKDDNIKNLLLTRYKQLRNNEWSNDYVCSLIDNYEKQIFDSGAYFRDMKRWPEGIYLDSSYNLESFKEYVLKRLDYFDKYIENFINEF